MALPQGNPCPECGHAAEEGEVVFWGACPPASLTTRDALGVWLFLAPAAVLLAAFVTRILIDRTGALGRMLVPIAVVVSIGLSLLTVWLHRPRDAPGKAQLRLSPRGWATRYGYGPVRWKPWRQRSLRMRERETALSGSRQLILDRVFLGVPLMPVLTFTFRGAPHDAGRAMVLARRYLFG